MATPPLRGTASALLQEIEGHLHYGKRNTEAACQLLSLLNVTLHATMEPREARGQAASVVVALATLLSCELNENGTIPLRPLPPPLPLLC